MISMSSSSDSIAVWNEDDTLAVWNEDDTLASEELLSILLTPLTSKQTQDVREHVFRSQSLIGILVKAMA